MTSPTERHMTARAWRFYVPKRGWDGGTAGTECWRGWGYWYVWLLLVGTQAGTAAPEMALSYKSEHVLHLWPGSLRLDVSPTKPCPGALTEAPFVVAEERWTGQLWYGHLDRGILTTPLSNETSYWHSSLDDSQRLGVEWKNTVSHITFYKIPFTWHSGRDKTIEREDASLWVLLF